MRRGSRQPYTPCRIFIDGLFSLEAGHYITTAAGSAYLVQKISQSPSRPYRRYLACLRWPINEIPSKATVHELHWYARKRKRN